MKTMLVGYTGFVGSNLSCQYDFTERYNSKNIEDAYGSKPDLLIYAGVRAEKYLANQDSNKDLNNIENALHNIQQIQPRKLVLISTIDVYKSPINVNEDTPIISEDLQPYGANRYYLEQIVRDDFPETLIIRLPGLFGKNIKKNFIYDYIHYIPSMIQNEKFEKIATVRPELNNYYKLQDNGFYKCSDISCEEKETLKTIFKELGFSALNFTDSRGVFQFYNLKHLWNHIQYALKNDLYLLNLATEPIGIAELYHYLEGKKFQNIISNNPPYYDFKTKHDILMGGKRGYIFDKDNVLAEIKTFIQEQSC